MGRVHSRFGIGLWSNVNWHFFYIPISGVDIVVPSAGPRINILCWWNPDIGNDSGMKVCAHMP
eukprot:5516661-Amphidinium_carterae.1